MLLGRRRHCRRRERERLQQLAHLADGCLAHLGDRVRTQAERERQQCVESRRPIVRSAKLRELRGKQLAEAPVIGLGAHLTQDRQVLQARLGQQAAHEGCQVLDDSNLDLVEVLNEEVKRGQECTLRELGAEDGSDVVQGA